MRQATTAWIHLSPVSSFIFCKAGWKADCNLNTDGQPPQGKEIEINEKKIIRDKEEAWKLFSRKKIMIIIYMQFVQLKAHVIKRPMTDFPMRKKMLIYFKDHQDNSFYPINYWSTIAFLEEKKENGMLDVRGEHYKGTK